MAATHNIKASRVSEVSAGPDLPPLGRTAPLEGKTDDHPNEHARTCSTTRHPTETKE
jgi:hypothetical protein